MRLDIFVFLVLGLNSQSVFCAGRSKECTSFKTALDDIHELLEEEAETHGFNLEVKGGKTYFSRTEYVLSVLNSKVKAKAQKSGSCSGLEVEILARTKEFGIEKIGLEDSLTRLRKVFNYQDDRYKHQLVVLEEFENKTQACEEDRIVMESVIQSMNSTHSDLLNTIKQLKEQINIQEKKYQILQAKINSNAPAIHGSTGVIYGDDKQRANITEETTNVPLNATVESVPDGRNATADIDVRNSS